MNINTINDVAACSTRLSDDDLLDIIISKLSDSSWESVVNHLMIRRYIRDARLIQSFNKKGGTILDFGCGEGQNTLILKSLGYEVKGIDIHNHSSWKNIDADFSTYEGTTLPFKDNLFDSVAMFGVLEHVGKNPKSKDPFDQDESDKSRKLSLKECFRCLKSEGYLFVFNFPNKYSPIEIVNEIFMLPAIHLGSEKQSLGMVKKLVASQGFKIIRAGRSGVLPASIGFILPKFRDEFINPFSKQIFIVDKLLDKFLGFLLGQSNFIIAKKP